jgi:hypothetical protein
MNCRRHIAAVFKIPPVLRRPLNQGYETEANAEEGIESVKTNAPSAPIVDLPGEPAHN